eukprot:gene20557-24427_t
MLSLAVMMLSVAIIKGFKTEIQDKVRGFVGDIRIFKLDLNNSFELSPFKPGPETIRALKNNRDIAYFQPYSTKPAIISANDEVEGINFKGIDQSYNWDYIKKHLQSGRVINFSDSAKANQQILISSFTAQRLKLKTGDDFIMTFVQDHPRKRKFKIVGIYDIGVEEIDKSFVIGNINIIRRLNNWGPDDIGGIEIGIKKFSSLPKVAEDVYENLGANLKSESVRDYFPNIFSWLSLLDVNTRVLLVTNMIGMLKAFGMTDLSIIKIFLYNAAYLVGIGLLLGNLLGLGLGFLQKYTQIFKLTQSSYYLKYVPIELHFIDVLVLNVATMLISGYLL